MCPWNCFLSSWGQQSVRTMIWTWSKITPCVECCATRQKKRRTWNKHRWFSQSWSKIVLVYLFTSWAISLIVNEQKNRLPTLWNIVICNWIHFLETNFRCCCFSWPSCYSRRYRNLGRRRCWRHQCSRLCLHVFVDDHPEKWNLLIGLPEWGMSCTT